MGHHRLRFAALALAPPLFLAASARADEPTCDAAQLSVRIELDVLGAEILVDGASVGRSPLLAPVCMTPGTHTITVNATGYAPVQQHVSGGAGETRTTPILVVPRRKDVVGYDLPTTQPAPEIARPNRAIIIAGGATAGVAFVLGAAFTVLAVGKGSAASDARKQLVADGGAVTTCAAPTGGFVADCATLHDALTKRDSMANAALESYFVGAVVLGATIAYALWPTRRTRDRWEPSIARVRPEPLIGRGLGGLVLTGSF